MQSDTNICRSASYSNRCCRKLYRTCAALLVTAAIVVFVGCGKKETTAAPPPPQVDVVEVAQEDVPNFNEWVAQLNGEINAQITPKIQGYLLRQVYKDGTFVRKGELLFEIDPRPFQAALALLGEP